MPRRDASKRAEAARVYSATGNVSQTARTVGVHRTTVQRWLTEPDFLEVQEPAVVGFEALIPKAMHVLDDSLEGKKVTQSQIRAALEVVKASKALQSIKPTGPGLADLIAELDAEVDGFDSD